MFCVEQAPADHDHQVINMISGRNSMFQPLLQFIIRGILIIINFICMTWSMQQYTGRYRRAKR